MMATPHDSAPDQARRSYEEGLARLSSGDRQAARSAFTRALALDDSLAAAHYQLGNCLRLSGEESAAEQALRHAISLDPGLADAYFSLGFMLRDQGRVSEIDTLLIALANARPEDAERIEQAAGLLAEYGCIETALDLFERALSQRPTLARLHLRVGQMLQNLGQFAQSSNALETAIKCDPGFGPAYLLLAHTRKANRPDDARLALCQSKLAEADLPDNTRICLHFALGKLLDDLGDFSAAFRQFQAGNQLRRRQAGYDRATWEQFFETQRQMPAPPTVPSRQTNPTPVFIIGMLRSGTTLVERMLSNHTSVYALGETEMVDRLAETLSQHAGIPYPLCLRRLTAEHLENLADQYRARWPREALKARYVLDKNPLNFMHLGFITQLFPDSHFIHCQRDARDTALSIYFQNFAHPRNAYAYDLDDIAHFYTGYRKLMARWHTLFAPRIHDVIYENVVANPEREMRKLTDTLELAWEPGCASPQAGDNAISTASVWQARQPVYRDSVGRWRNYADQLAPFMAAIPPSARPLPG